MGASLAFLTMAWFADLSPCTYFTWPPPPALSAVGWLSCEHEYPVGPVQPFVVARLQQLLKMPFCPWLYLGYHFCEFCPESRPEAPPDVIRRGRFADWKTDLATTIVRDRCAGTRNLLVPGEREVYACPELIVHYIGAHGYAPPEEFCHALLHCPPIPSIDYFRRLLRVDGEAWASFIETLLDPDPLIAERLRQRGFEPTRRRPGHMMRVALDAVRLWRSP